VIAAPGAVRRRRVGLHADVGVAGAAADVVGVHVQGDLHPGAQGRQVQEVVVVLAAVLVAVGIGVGDLLYVGAELGAVAGVGGVGGVAGGHLDPEGHVVVGVELPAGRVLGVVAGETAPVGVGGVEGVVVGVELGVKAAAGQGELQAAARDGVG